MQRSEEPVDEYLRDDQPHRRAYADGREEHNEQPDDHGVGNQYAAITKAPQNARHRQLEAHGRRRLGRHEETGLDRRKSQAHLIEERKKKRNSANAQAGEKAAADRRAKGANAKKRQI